MTDTPNDTGDYEAELRDLIRQAHAEITTHEAEREEINAKIEAVVSNLEAKGIARRAFKNGRAWAMLNPDEQKVEDEAARIVKDALRPAQDDLLNIVEPR